MLDSEQLRFLFHPANLDQYAEQMTTAIARLASATAAADQPLRSCTPDQAALTISAIDLDRPLADTRAALDEVSALWLQHAVWFHDPRYVAHLNCPVVIPSLLAEVMMSAVNPSLDTFDQSLGGTFIERHLIEWTAQRIGFTDGDGVFTSGGTQSNLQALLLARESQPGSTRILASADSHFSLGKSARLLGLGSDSVLAVPTDDDRRLDPVALARLLAECRDRGEQVMAVVATAGTTDFGQIDPLRATAALAREYDAWFHVDAAYGGGLLTSSTRRDWLAGIELADSVTVDYHKTFFQPVSSSALIVRDAASLAHVTWHADYLNPAESTNPNQVDKSLQTTRRFDALKLWLTLRIMGPDLIGDYFDTVIDLARVAHRIVAAHSDFEVAATPGLSTLVFRYTRADLDDASLDRLNRRIRERLFERGDIVVAGTKHADRSWLKFTLLNPMLTNTELADLVATIADVAAELAPPRLRPVENWTPGLKAIK